MLKKSENVDEMQGSVLKDESENNVHPSQIPFTTGSPNNQIGLGDPDNLVSKVSHTWGNIRKENLC